MHALSPPQRHAAWSLRIQEAEYSALLPTLARIPTALGYAVARWRGRFNARFDRDWVSLALGHRHVADLSAAGYAEFLPPPRVAAAVVERFETASREEYESRLLERRGLGAFRVDAGAALSQLAARPRDRGLVLVTSHYETFILGIAALASRGERIHPMMSTISADPRLTHGVRNHFVAKYAGLERHLSGGRLANAENSMRHLYRVLRDREIVVVIADAPGTMDAGVPVPWFNGRRWMAQGALRLAQATGSAMAAFMCTHQSGVCHEVKLSEVESEVDGLRGLQAYNRLYAFMERHIRGRPGRWWASHLLTSCPKEHGN